MYSASLEAVWPYLTEFLMCTFELTVLILNICQGEILTHVQKCMYTRMLVGLFY